MEGGMTALNQLNRSSMLKTDRINIAILVDNQTGAGLVLK
jgi:hypothetical protein